MRKLMFVSLLLFIMACQTKPAPAAPVHVGGKWFYVDVVICENPPEAIEWCMLNLKVQVWEEGNAGNVDEDNANTCLASASVHTDHYLQGSPKVWNVSVLEKHEQRVYGYDGKHYLVSWRSQHDYDIKGTNTTTIHVDFTWKLDPNQA